MFSYLRAILRWCWVTIIMVGATVMVIQSSAADVPLVYTSTVKFEVSAPEPNEVALFSSVRTGTTNEEIAMVQNDFSVITRGAVTARMTIDTLGLKMNVQEMQDKVVTEIPPYSSFVYIHVTDASAKDAQTIARVHAENSLKYYGEARAKTTVVRKQFITQQLQSAADAVAAARSAVQRFQMTNGTADLTRDVQGLQDSIRTLRTERDRNLVEIERVSTSANYYTSLSQKATADNDAAAATSYRASAAASQATAEGLRSAVVRQNEIIAQRENDLVSLVGLTAEYDRLRAEVQRAENNYNFLEGKLIEADTKENDARSAGFIQMIEPAQTPTRAQRAQTRNLLIPGIAVSLVAGTILSFVLEYIFFGRRRRRASEKQ